LTPQSHPLPVTGNTEHTQPENRAFYPALDGLRAVAFLMVFFQHYYSIPWGWTGVNIFFVLSGFLITGILFDSRDDAHRARNFYVRRTLRIFPLYYGIFLGLLLTYPLLHWEWNVYWLAWPLYLANYLRFISHSAAVYYSPLQLAGNAWLTTPLLPHTQLFFGHFWSLCVEEQFYLVWPWVVFRVRSRRALLWICGLAVVVVPITRLIAHSMAPEWMIRGELLYRATPFQLDSLLLGGLVALLWRGQYRAQLLSAARVVTAACFLATVVYLSLTIHASGDPNWHNGYHYPVWMHTWGMTFVDFFSAALIVCCLQRSGWLSKVFGIYPLRWIGRISYGAYVFHDVFHDLYTHILVGVGHHHPFLARHVNELVLPFALGGTLLISWLSFRFFETPFLNLKERWTIRRERAEQVRGAIPGC
jgi:peptidoglycan/LPS O-acetylase OafA/YrhL